MAYSTQQKTIVSSVLETAERPLTPVEICELAKGEWPEIGIATVYRAIREYLKSGTVRLVDLPGASPHYEHSSRQHHHFFLCEACRKIFNLPRCVQGVDAIADKGFLVERHEIVLFGRCPACRPKKK